MNKNSTNAPNAPFPPPFISFCLSSGVFFSSQDEIPMEFDYFNSSSNSDDCCHPPGQTSFPTPCSAMAPFSLDTAGTCHSAFIESSEEFCGGYPASERAFAFVPSGTVCTAKCAADEAYQFSEDKLDSAQFTCVDGVWEGELVCNYQIPSDPKRLAEESGLHGNQSFNHIKNIAGRYYTDVNSITLYNGNVYRGYPERNTFGGSLQRAAETVFCGVRGHMATFKDSEELHVIAKVVHRSTIVFTDGTLGLTTPTKESVIGNFTDFEDDGVTPDYRKSGPYRFWIPLVAQGRKAVSKVESLSAMGTLSRLHYST